jgi:hypothetical protein
MAERSAHIYVIISVSYWDTPIMVMMMNVESRKKDTTLLSPSRNKVNGKRGKWKVVIKQRKNRKRACVWCGSGFVGQATHRILVQVQIPNDIHRRGMRFAFRWLVSWIMKWKTIFCPRTDSLPCRLVCFYYENFLLARFWLDDFFLLCSRSSGRPKTFIFPVGAVAFANWIFFLYISAGTTEICCYRTFTRFCDREKLFVDQFFITRSTNTDSGAHTHSIGFLLRAALSCDKRFVTPEKKKILAADAKMKLKWIKNNLAAEFTKTLLALQSFIDKWSGELLLCGILFTNNKPDLGRRAFRVTRPRSDRASEERGEKRKRKRRRRTSCLMMDGLEL